MVFFLDTNVLVACLRGRSAAAMKRLAAEPAANIQLPLQVVAELLVGAAKSADPLKGRDRVRQLIRPFAIARPDEGVLDHYVEIRTALERAGTPIGEANLWIAATARAAGGTVVTHNTNEFSRVPGLAVEDWL
jgi:tRNA(fMet)-specific endonuclease VapC